MSDPIFKASYFDFGQIVSKGYPSPTSYFGYPSLTLGDIDTDGDLDAFVGDQSGTTKFYRNIGTSSVANFVNETPNGFYNVTSTTVKTFAKPNLVDIDADGDLDIFVGDSNGDMIFFRNTGTATYANFAAPATNPFGLLHDGYGAAPAFGDIDGDGDLDVFVGKPTGDILFYRNTGTANKPVFSAPIYNQFGLNNIGFYANPYPTLVDIDGDSDLDAFVGNNAGNTLFFPNIGTKNQPIFSAPSTNPFGLTDVGDFKASLTFADINNDGDLDVFIASSLNIKYYENITGENHAPTGSVVINDTTPETEQTLTANNTLADVDGLGVITYHWKVAGVNVDTGKTYLVTAADIGKVISVIATYTDGLGNVETVGSASTSKVTLGKLTLNGTAGDDLLIGDSSDNILNGYAGNDLLDGDAGNDSIIGGLGNDLLNGGLGNDTLNGGAGNDALFGGAGKDKLTGDTGADKFKFAAVTETGITATTRDTITDFKHAQADKIDLSAIDANTAIAGNQAFSFIGTAAFSTTNAAGQLRFDAINHLVYGSNDADTAPEFSILLTGVTSLVATDFIL